MVTQMEQLTQQERLERIKAYAGGLEPEGWERFTRHQALERRNASRRRTLRTVLLFMAIGAAWFTWRGYVGFAVAYTLAVLICIGLLIAGARRV
jgi:hypothetical protein